MKSKTGNRQPKKPIQYVSLAVDSPEEALAIYEFFDGSEGIELDIWFNCPLFEWTDENGNVMDDMASDDLRAAPSSPSVTDC